MRTIRSLLFAVLAAFIAAPAEAAPLRFDLSSTCAVNCSAIGLMTGDAVGGFIVLESDAFIPPGGYNSQLNASTVIDFDVVLGDVRLTFSESFAHSFQANTSTPTDLGEWFLAASEADSSGSDLGDGFFISSFFSSNAGGATACTPDCTTFVTGDPIAGLNAFSASLSASPTAAVPLPATAFLLLGGLGLMAAARRKT